MRDGNLSGDERTLLRDFDTSCFVQSAVYTIGNEGRNVLRQRGLRNLNLGIDKSFNLYPRERVKLQIRGEMFNATNTPFFALPNAGCCGSPTFGQIQSTQRDARVVQMGAKVLFNFLQAVPDIHASYGQPLYGCYLSAFGSSRSRWSLSARQAAPPRRRTARSSLSS